MKLWGCIIRTWNAFKNTQCVQTLYYSLVRSKLEYGAVIWNPYYRKDIIEKPQRRYLKYIYYKEHNVYSPQGISYSQLLTYTNDDSLHYRRLLSGIKIIYNLLHNKVSCEPLLSSLKFSNRRLSTRKPLMFTENIPCTNILIKSPMYVICQNLNAVCNLCDIYSVNFNLVATHFHNHYHANLNIFK